MALVLGSVGDVNPIDYGGGPIYGTSNGARGPWLEHFDGIDSEIDSGAIRDPYDDSADERIESHNVRIYRVDLHDSGEALLSHLDWVDWDEIRRFTGSDASAYTVATLDTPIARAHAACDVASYHGWDNLDSYPLELTIGALRVRWGES